MACDLYWNKTVLACHFDGTNGSTTFTDEKGHALTANGNAQVSTAQSKFGGSSAYFDGSSYLSVGASTDIAPGGGDFTIEGWVYLASPTTYQFLLGSADNAAGYLMLAFNAYAGEVDVGRSGIAWPLRFSGFAVSANTWFHLAITRSGTQNMCFINGVSIGATITDSTVWTLPATSYIGSQTGGSPITGYVDDLRITKAARYAANFTPDTSAFVTNQCTISGTIKDATGANAKRLVRAFRRDTAALIGQTLSDATTGAYSLPSEYTGEHFVMAHDITSDDFLWDKVVLACHFDGTNGSTTFTDEKGHTLTANGNAQISTAQSKFGGASLYLDGTGDYVSAANNTDYDFGSGDFTIEMRVRPSSLAATQCLISKRTDSGAHYRWILLSVNTNGTLNTQITTDGTSWAVNANTTSTISAGEWNHVALCRSGANVVFYVNGVANALSSTFSGSVYSSTEAVLIGCGGTTGAYINYANGHIDDLRITKAARYTANFTPPTQAFSTTNAAGTGTENAVILDRILPA